MFDPFQVDNRRQHQLRIVDYRNGKYQGDTLSNPLTRQGFGMILDHNYLLGVGDWNNGILNGETFVMFPDCTYFYGSLENTFPTKLCYFQTANKCGIYSLISNNNDNYLVFDFIEGKYMQFAVVGARVMKKLIQEPVNERYLLQEYGNGNGTGQVAFINQVKYGNDVERLQIIQQFFKTKINSQFINYKQFIKYHFSKKINNHQAKLEVIDSKEQFQFKFKKSSIVFKSTNSQNPNFVKLKALGFHDINFNKMEISKKYNDSFSKIEETVLGVPIVYTGNLMHRSRQCMTKLHTYYKQSLFFINEYVGIDYLYRIKFIFQAIQIFFGQSSMKNEAQKLLQNPKPLTRSRQQFEPYDKLDYRTEKEKFGQKETLQKIKKDVYLAANKSFNNGQPSHKHQALDSSLSKVANKRTASNQMVPKKINAFQTPGKRKSFAEQRQKYINTAQIPNRSMIYLLQDKDRTLHRNFTRTDIANDEAAVDRSKNSKSPSQLSKFAYLQKESKVSNTKNIQNIRALTQYYEEIENELKKESFYNKNKEGPSQKSKHGLTQKNKESKWQDHKKISQFKVLSDFSLSNKTYTKERTNPATTVLGPKRALKFQWE